MTALEYHRVCVRSQGMDIQFLCRVEQAKTPLGVKWRCGKCGRGNLQVPKTGDKCKVCGSVVSMCFIHPPVVRGI